MSDSQPSIEREAAYYFSEIRKFLPLDLDHYSLENWKDFIVWRESVASTPGTRDLCDHEPACETPCQPAVLSSAAPSEREAELSKEITRLKLQYTVAECYWDEDAHHDSPEEFADENDLKVGAEFELQAATYWKEKFRVTKVPDDVSDDYECETLSQQREEFQTYQEMEARLAKIEAELQAARAAAPQNDTEEVATQIWRLTTGAEPSDTPQDDIDRGEIEAIAKLLRPLRAAAPQASPR